MKRLQREHWQRFFQGRFDQAYLDKLEALGRVHARIGLTPAHYLSGCAQMLESVIEALTQREFMPEILRLVSVNHYATPSVWQIETDRGSTELVLKGEEDIRRLSAHTLVVADAHGVQFLIRDLPSLDRHTRKLLDRFL